MIFVFVDKVSQKCSFINILGNAVIVDTSDINNIQYTVHTDYYMSDDCGYSHYEITEVPTDYYFEIVNLAIDRINQINFGNSSGNSYLTDFQRVGTWDDRIFSLLVKNNNQLYVEYLCSEDKYTKRWLLFNVDYLSMLNYLYKEISMDTLFMMTNDYMKLTRVEFDNGKRGFIFKTISPKDALIMKSNSVFGNYDTKSPLNCETIAMKKYLSKYLNPDEKVCGNCEYMLWNNKGGCMCGYDDENSGVFNVDPKIDGCTTFKKREK